MRYFLWFFVLIEMFGRFMGNGRINGYLDIVWLIFWGLFIVFICIPVWKDMFKTEKMKKDKEG